MSTRDELLRAMIELAAVNREAYRELRADAWDRVVRNHQAKTPEQIAAWKRDAS